MVFNPGDVVRHKSGGPKMIVVEYGTWGMASEEKGYRCRWWDEKNTTFSDRVFAEVELEAYRASGGPGGATRGGGPQD
jgi:uncharacterized protein YodC (DUF2158 family)